MLKTIDFKEVKMFSIEWGRVFYLESLKFLPNPVPLLTTFPVDKSL